MIESVRAVAQVETWSEAAGGWGVLLALLLPVMGGSPAVAQDASSADSTRWRPYQIGFAASDVLKLLEEAGAQAQYQLYGRYRLDRRWALRTALRYRHRVSDEQEVRLGLRAGADYVFLEEGRLQLYGGTDLVSGYDRFLNGDRTYRIGLAPLFGILFSISPSISLSTEPRLVATYAYVQNRGSAEPTSESVSLEVRGTGILILNVHF